MFFEVCDNKTHKLIGITFVCHGCGEQSPIRKRHKLPPRWTEKTELAYGNTGQRRKGMGWAVNFYCGVCTAHGCSAHTVAATTRKFLRKGSILNEDANDDGGC